MGRFNISESHQNPAVYTRLSGDRKREKEGGGDIYPSVKSVVLKNRGEDSMRYELTGKEVFGYDGDKFEWRISRLRTAEASAIQLAEAESVASPGIDIPRPSPLISPSP